MPQKTSLETAALQKLARDIIAIFPKAHLYMVGGAVRDKILNRPMRDIDIVVCGVPSDKLLQFLQKNGSVNLVGKTYGVFKWRPATVHRTKLSNIDIALPRTEIGIGTGKRKDFSVQSDHRLNIEKDLERRDFTINAICCDVLSGRYYDPFCGRQDIAKKIVKAVGSPEKRYKEDYSRILRAIRFALELGFAIETKTWRAIKNNAHKTREVTREIAAKELALIFLANPSRALDLMYESGILKKLMPEISALKKCRQPKKWHSEGTVWTHTKLALSSLAQISKHRRDPNLVFALLFHDIGKPQTKKLLNNEIKFYNHAEVGVKMASKIISRLKLESAGINKAVVLWLIKNHMILFSNDPMKLKNTTIEKYFLSSRYPSHLLLALIECDSRSSIPSNQLKRDNLCNLNIIKKRIKEIKKRPVKPILNGYEIMKIIGIAPGKRIGDILELLREAELSGSVKTKSQAKKFIMEAPQIQLAQNPHQK